LTNALVKRTRIAYTQGMFTVAWIALLLTPGQTPDLVWGEVPERAATFRIIFQNDATPCYAGILVDNQWVTDPSSVEASIKNVVVVSDTPWEPRQRVSTVLSKIQVDYYEPPALRKKRIQEGWAKAGYVFVDTVVDGQHQQRPVLKQELELAQRARAMDEAVVSKLEPAAAGTGEGEAANAALDAEAPGLLRLWGGHMLLGGFSLVLMGLAVRWVSGGN
jgi:hypothetical protein